MEKILKISKICEKIEYEKYDMFPGNTNYLMTFKRQTWKLMFLEVVQKAVALHQ